MTSFFELSDSPRRVDDEILSTLESVCNLSRSNVGDITFRGVDGRRRLIQVRKKPFITNGFNPADFTFICADILSDGEYLQHNLPIKTKVVIANIGPTYGDVDQKVVEFLSNLPHTQIFIGAGHVKNRQAGDYNDQLLEWLRQAGFSQNYREIVDSDSRLAFIIERY